MIRAKPEIQNKEPEPTPDLSSSSHKPTISEARATTIPSTTSFSSRPAVSSVSLLHGKKSIPSQQSLATNLSFSTAIEPSSSSATTDVSYYSVDSNSDEETSTTTPEQYFPFSISNIKETMASKKLVSKMKGTTMPMPTAIAVSTPKPPPPTKAAPASDGEAKFDVTQTIYGATKDVWAFGKTVPFVSNLLGITDAVAMKALDLTFHVDYAAVDDKIKPQLKKLDDDLFTPPIAVVWKFIEPAVKFFEPFVEPVVGTADAYVLKPFMNEVVPKVLCTLGMGDEKKALENKSKIDMSPMPEFVPAFN